MRRDCLRTHRRVDANVRLPSARHLPGDHFVYSFLDFDEAEDLVHRRILRLRARMRGGVPAFAIVARARMLAAATVESSLAANGTTAPLPSTRKFVVIPSGPPSSLTTF